MEFAEETLLDLRPEVKKALEGMECPIPYVLRNGFSRAHHTAPLVVWREWSNVSTDCPVVDGLTFEVQLFAPDIDQLLTLARSVNRALLRLGLLRSYASPDEFDGQNYAKTFRFGRYIDKRTMRLVDR